jgi:hypothetical protein
MSSSRELQALDFLRGHALEDKLAAMRHLNNLGREVGERWGVGEVMRWDRNQVSDARCVGVVTRVESNSDTSSWWFSRSFTAVEAFWQEHR